MVDINVDINVNVDIYISVYVNICVDAYFIYVYLVASTYMLSKTIGREGGDIYVEVYVDVCYYWEEYLLSRSAIASFRRDVLDISCS